MASTRVVKLQGLYERWALGDFADVEIFDPDVECVWAAELPDADVDRGVDELRATMVRFMDAVEDLTMTGDEFIPAGDDVLVFVTIRGVGRRTGLEIEWRAAHLWTIPGERATRVVGYMERAKALSAAGLDGSTAPGS